MNKKRRKELLDVINRLEECCDDLSFIKDDEVDARDSMPENLESSEQHERLEDNCDTIDEALSDIRGAITSLQNI